MSALQRVLSVVVAVVVLGSFQESSAQSNRMTDRLGFHVGLLGDPFPTVVGINANYNVLDFLRASAGYGTVTSEGLTASTFGFGVRGMIPDWNFTPVVGLSWATVSVTVSGVAIGDLYGFTVSGSHLYATFGFDWQTGAGFNLGAGYNLSLKPKVGGLPYVNLGYYFAI
ncbi:MAG: hypothetical protein WEB37_13540 [Bacteroidota bacterium]